MSEGNVELMRRGYERWLSGDPGFADVWDPEIAWDISAHPLPDVPNEGRGRDDLIAHLATYMSGWTDYRGEIAEIAEVGGDHVLAVLQETASLGETEASLDRDLFQLWTVRDGRATFVRVFRTRREALEAAGLGP